ncbi:MAG: NADH-quinone oxidoreductase subunit NuoK [bacterium]
MNYILLSAIIFCIGLYGALSRKNGIMVLISIEIMLNAACLNLAYFSSFYNPAGQIFALFAIVISAACVGCGLAIFLLAFREKEKIDLDSFNLLKG